MCSNHTEVHEITGTSPLFSIIENNGPDVINELQFMFQVTNTSINDRIDSLNDTPLHFATFKNKKHIVEYLLSKSPDLNARNIVEETPLHIAINNSNIPITELLLRNGYDLDQKNNLGLTGFMMAIECGTEEMVQFLIKYVKDIQAYTTYSNNLKLTYLQRAVMLVRFNVVKTIIDHGVDVNYCIPGFKETPLHLICIHYLNDSKNEPDVEKIAELLIKAGADLNAGFDRGVTPLLLAIEANNFRLVNMLVRHGSDLNISLPKDNNTQTLLHIVVNQPKWKTLLDLFLRFGADYKIYNARGMAAYHLAVSNIQKLQVFWKYGCPYDLPLLVYSKVAFHPELALHERMFNEYFAGMTRCQQLLFDGIKSNNIKIVENALKLGAVVRGTSMDVKYPLHFVSGKGYDAITKLLLENGIKVNILNDKKMTAIQLAIKCKQIKICKLLFQYGACLNYKEEILKLETDNDKSGKEIQNLLKSIYLWFNLVKQGNTVIFDLMKDMLESDEEMFRVHLRALDKNNRSILALAIYYEHGEIVEEIMKNCLNFKCRSFGLTFN